jgi:outer membrane protein OmpA-like peptidoglycan-associated protein
MMYLRKKNDLPTYMMLNMRFIFILSLFLPLSTFSQNLLVNESFEDENICIEYRVNCAPEGWIYTAPSFNYYFKDKNLSHSGSHFVALLAGHSKKPFYRTYVRSRLLCGLRKGNTYRLQFFIKSRHSILDSMGIYFSPYDFLFEKKVYRKIDPSVYLTDAIEKPAKNDTGWQRVVIDYKARGDEAFITFGNFKKEDVTGATGIDRENNFFVLFDDVSLTPSGADEKLCSDWQKTFDEIYMQDERHQYLDRLIKMNRAKPLQAVKPSLTIVQKIDTLVVPDIFFESGKASLSKTAYSFLDSIHKIIGEKSIDSIVVEGHTDSTGTFELNQKLGNDRADAVVNYFQNGLSEANFIIRSWGSEKPVADNRTAAGRQRNRRVEIYLYVRE